MMKKIILLILFFTSLSFSQTSPVIKAYTVYADTHKVFRTTYGTLDTQYYKSRAKFTRPTEFDSLVRFFTNFAVPLGSSYDSTRIPYLDKANTFTARQTMTSLAVDTIVAKSSGNKVYLQDSLRIKGNLTTGTSSATAPLSNAMGSSTVTGVASFGAGEVFVTADYAAAFGNSTASGTHSFAAGEENEASGYASAAFGSGGAVGDFSFSAGSSGAIGDYSTSLGQSVSNGAYSFSAGASNSTGDYSTALGNSTAIGAFSLSLGSTMTVTGNYSFGVSLGNVTTNVLQEGVAYFMGTSTSKMSLGAFFPDSSFTDSLGTGGGHFYGGLKVDGNLSSGTITSIGGVASVGSLGVPVITDTVTYTGVASSIAAKNLVTTVGVYRLSFFLSTTTAGTSGTVTMTLSYNNGSVQTETRTILCNTVLLSAGGVDNGTIVYKVASGTPTIATTYTGVGGAVYSLDATVERIK